MRIFNKTNHLQGLRLLLSCAFLLVAGVISAEIFNVDGIYYEGYDGGTANVIGIDLSVTSDMVEIPATVLYGRTTYTVTAIDPNVFQGKDVRTVVLPNTVTELSERFFAGCSRLVSVTLPESLSYISEGLFENCESLNRVVIPETVTGISSYAFNGCSALSEVSIPESVTGISSYAFSDCSALSEVSIPDNASIGEGAFNGCTGLKKLTLGAIPDGAIDKYNNPFSECTSLSHLSINHGVGKLSLPKFEYVTDLYIDREIDMEEYRWESRFPNVETLSIGTHVEKLSERLFYGCHALYSVAIPSNIINIEELAFYGCSNLSTLTIAEGVKNIGDGAFSVCSSVKSITLPLTLDSINAETFSGCTSLSDVVLPEHLQFIGSYAFQNCSSLTEINLPVSLDSLEGTFAGCSSLKSIKIPENLRIIGERTFEGCSALDSIAIPLSVTTMGYHAFAGCKSLRAMTMANGVRKIGADAFEDCTKLQNLYYNGTIADWCKIYFAANESEDTSPVRHAQNMYLKQTDDADELTLLTDLVIPEGVDSIPAYAFTEYRKLASLTVPSTVDYIGEYAFSRCYNMTKADINARVIKERAFFLCQKLNDLTFGNHLEKMETEAFFYAAKPTNLYYNGTWHGWLHIKRGKKALEGAQNFYMNGEFVAELILPNDVVEIEDYAMYGIKSITSIVIENSLKKIGDYAFYGCEGLRSVGIKLTDASFGKSNRIAAADNGLSIGEMAFAYCTDLSEVSLPNNVSYIGSYAFDDTPWLASLPDGLNYIGKTAYCYKGTMPENTSIDIKDGTVCLAGGLFQDQANLASVYIPESVTAIGGSAFYGCSGLSSVAIPSGVTQIESQTFAYCTGLSSMTIPSGVVMVRSNAFAGATGLRDIFFADGKDSLDIVIKDGRYETLFVADSPIESLYIGRNMRYHYITEYGTYYFIVQLPCEELRALKIGAELTGLDIPIYYVGETITVFATTPPRLVDFSFNEETKQNCLLRIPEGTRAAYAQADEWKDFLNVEEFDATAIDTPSVSGVCGEGVHYDISGRKTSPSAKGLHIIRMEDGTSRKVIVR